MRTKVIVDIDEINNVYDKYGVLIQGVLLYRDNFNEYKENSITLELIKQGVSPDEIIKLKNNGLI